MFPVRVVVETVRDTECVGCAESGPVLADSYAIVSGHTSLSQLVDTVLAALGLQQLAYGAKGLYSHFFYSITSIIARATPLGRGGNKGYARI